MSHQQPQQSPHAHQQPAQAMAQHAQGMMSPSLDASVAQSSDAMAQLASQVQATMGASQQMQAVTAAQVSLQMNPNAALAQLLSLQQNNQVMAAMGAIPLMWNAPVPHAAVAYQMPVPAVATNNNWGYPSILPQQGATQQLVTEPATVKSQQASARSPKPAPQEINTRGVSPIPSAMPSSSLVLPDDAVDSELSSSDSNKNSKNGASTGSKVKQNRERNREHARSTRQRKKAYVHKLREMAESLRAVQTEEIQQRRTSVQQMKDMQKVRRSVVKTVLRYHSTYQGDAQKWSVLLEDSFWFKQPITPFRCFRRSEVEKDYRILRGTDAMIADAASMSTMVERIGSRNTRWRQIKRKRFLQRLEALGVPNPFDQAMILNQRAESSLSSASSTDSSYSSSGSGHHKRDRPTMMSSITTRVHTSADKKVSSSSGESSSGKRMSDDSDEYWTGNQLAAAEVPNGARAKRHKGDSSVVPAKIAKSGGIVHGVRTTRENQLTIQSGLGQFQSERKSPTLIVDLLANNVEELGSYYAVNEDDMIMIDDILMCPFVFRTKNAVLCGALADCVMPGMLRASFSKANKLLSMEIIYDAMGFMQQLDGANGGEITAQVIPGSLEMALMHSPHEARVITEAKPPYSVVHVNESWTHLTKYSQLEVEGRELLDLLEGEGTDPDAGVRPGRPVHNLEDVAAGRSACSTNVHYDKFGGSFLDYMCSYPLTNSADEICHLLHINQELPSMKPSV